MVRIGFVGLGHMGLPMAINLVKAGYQVTGFDLQKEAVDSFTNSGGIKALSLADAAKNQDVIITMLQTGEQVSQVCLNDNGLFANAAANSLYIDCSSIDVTTSRELHRQAAMKDLLVVDAPVSGGVAGAQAATLTFMVGGEEQAFAQAKPILSAIGKTIIHTGAAGSGQAAKICNNMILGISMIAISEAFVLAKHLGLSEKSLFEVVNSSSGQCWAISKYVPVPGILPNVPANNNYQPGFTSAMMLKDLNLSQNSAAAAGIETPMGALATATYRQFNEAGQGQLDFSAIIKAIANE
ncbi:3-hydroxyisobutyrate dehydrogenase [Legionella micdadei]|uniref:3-hydroxyisobutyrate dehydrogenase n=1 Tax=Legionella micdadei TaxID=451 RepID=A0A098GC14_LEGMI|nr:3-hydroxyisobutyrate dehydrogenase [Legionella micdadei]ARG96313.1 3-hydroxyisobutyrate dehydrogenase [Legionella micdadei]ARG99068.1 3-hydroxyisobutyrate dehydrogenase [Legionella micdadei]KTD29766.1 3-hydroxyisobutyrate dehydrogenase [Legionella micdadei]NSL19426.1 3-hydroxyisobutyrate dehydrogenase [Legionella micdadei]CEG59507.1 putative 3-hydroxyisobutyrate dehydrogenase [Legionella micdadei]